MFMKLTKTAASIFLLALSTGALSAQITVTSPNVLLPASAAIAYEPYSLTATGGTPPYSWTVIGVGVQSLPPGMTLSSSGTISGQPSSTGQFTPIIKVTDSAGNSATQQFSLYVAPSAGTLNRTGVLAQVAAGAGWSTEMYLVNTSSTVYESAMLTFREDQGTPLFLPLTILQQGISQSVSVSNWNFTLAPNTTVVIQTTTPPSGALAEGWADVFTTGGVGSFGIFSQTLPNGVVAEGTSSSSGQFPGSLVLPYDNTSNFVTTAGLVNLSAFPSTVTATIWDANGNQLGTQQLSISTLAHMAFSVPTQFPVTAGKQGSIVFASSNTDAGLAGLGLSFSPLTGGSFTSVPMLPATM
jgi:large repetitive protein